MHGTTQRAPQSRIRDQDFPGLLTAFYDTAAVLDNNGGPLDAAGTRVLKRVAMRIADLRRRLSLDATRYACLVVLRSRAEAFGGQFLTIIDQAVEFLKGVVTVEGGCADLQAAYGGLRLARGELVGGGDSQPGTRGRVP